MHTDEYIQLNMARDFFNDLLADSCSNPSDDEEGFNEYHFTIEAHCSITKIKVIAKCINREEAMKVEGVKFRYQIKSIEKV